MRISVLFHDLVGGVHADTAETIEIEMRRRTQRIPKVLGCRGVAGSTTAIDF